MVSVIVKVHVYCWKYHPCVNNLLVQYFQILYTCRNEDICEVKGVCIDNFEVDLCSSCVDYCSISNVNSSYQCSCK